MPGPSFLVWYTVSGSIGMIAVLLFVLNHSLARARWNTQERQRAVVGTAVILVSWFLATAALAWVGAYQGGSGRIPTIQFGIFVPILLGAALIWRSATVFRIIDAVPQHWLVGVQVYRVLGFIFVVLYMSGELPGLFALPAGLGDLAVGLLALLVAWTYLQRGPGAASSVRAWNWFGIGDLAVAISTGFLTAPSSLQMFARDNPNTLIDAFPLALIPVFLVPLSIVLHMASLIKLRREPAHISSRTKATAPA